MTEQDISPNVNHQPYDKTPSPEQLNRKVFFIIGASDPNAIFNPFFPEQSQSRVNQEHNYLQNVQFIANQTNAIILVPEGLPFNRLQKRPESHMFPNVLVYKTDNARAANFPQDCIVATKNLTVVRKDAISLLPPGFSEEGKIINHDVLSEGGRFVYDNYSNSPRIVFFGIDRDVESSEKAILNRLFENASIFTLPTPKAVGIIEPGRTEDHIDQSIGTPLLMKNGYSIVPIHEGYYEALGKDEGSLLGRRQNNPQIVYLPIPSTLLNTYDLLNYVSSPTGDIFLDQNLIQFMNDTGYKQDSFAHPIIPLPQPCLIDENQNAGVRCRTKFL